MLDAVGYIWLILLGGPFIIAVIVLALPLDARMRWIVASILGAWFLFTLFTAFPSVGRVPGSLLGRYSGAGCRGPLFPKPAGSARSRWRKRTVPRWGARHSRGRRRIQPP
jgi:hypothetical protein